MDQHYSLECRSIKTLLNWFESGDMVIPEIQRPFVWNTSQVCDFIDSLYRGYPVGYLITWLKSEVPVRPASQSTREYLLIDGQQRIMALWTALHGKTVLTKKYQRQSIKIAFHPINEKFEVAKASHGEEWIDDISTIFTDVVNSIREYCSKNSDADRDRVSGSISQLSRIRNTCLGVIKLDSELTGEIVADIFNRINSKGVRLTSPDFIMSKLAAIERYNSQQLRKSIDYFCHLAAVPEDHDDLEADVAFANTDYFRAIKWLGDNNRNKTAGLYVPDYTDVLRVIFTSEFKREDLGDLVNRLSDDSAEDTFYRLEKSILSYMSETNFNRFVVILQTAGFVTNSMTTAKNAVNSAYILFLTLRSQNVNSNQIERLVTRWFVMSVLTGRYSRAPQATFGDDIRGITSQDGAETYLESLERIGLSEAFWTELPQKMKTSTTRSVYFTVFLASQVKQNDKGFLSRDRTIGDLLRGKKHIHHIFPKKHLKNLNISQTDRNQIANLTVMQGEINTALKDKAPVTYFSQLQAGCRDGTPSYGGINNLEDLKANFNDHCIPFDGLDISIFENYDKFLERRRKLMAKKIKNYYESLVT